MKEREGAARREVLGCVTTEEEDTAAAAEEEHINTGRQGQTHKLFEKYILFCNISRKEETHIYNRLKFYLFQLSPCMVLARIKVDGGRRRANKTVCGIWVSPPGAVGLTHGGGSRRRGGGRGWDIFEN